MTYPNHKKVNHSHGLGTPQGHEHPRMFYPWVSAVSLVLKHLAKWKVLIYSRIFFREDGDTFKIRLGCLDLPWGNNTPCIGIYLGVLANLSKIGETASPTPQTKCLKIFYASISGIPTYLCLLPCLPSVGEQ